MKLSSKARYGLACMLYISTQPHKVTVNQLALDLKLSPLYLQQVMTALKMNQLVISSQGSQGGYTLARDSKLITIYDCLITLEPSLFEPSEKTTDYSEIHDVLEESLLNPLDHQFKQYLQSITLNELSNKLKEHRSSALMYYI